MLVCSISRVHFCTSCRWWFFRAHFVSGGVLQWWGYITPPPALSRAEKRKQRVNSRGGFSQWWCCAVFLFTRKWSFDGATTTPITGAGVLECGCYIPANENVSGGVLCNRATPYGLHDCTIARIAQVVVGYTCGTIISLDSWDGGERVSCGTRSPVRWV